MINDKFARVEAESASRADSLMRLEQFQCEGGTSSTIEELLAWLHDKHKQYR